MTDLTWSKSKPTTIGWFLFRPKGAKTFCPAKVFRANGELHIQLWGDVGWFSLAYVRGMFAGPLQPRARMKVRY